MNTFVFQSSLGDMSTEKFTALLNDYKVLRFRALIEIRPLKGRNYLGEFEIAELEKVCGKTLVEEIATKLTEFASNQVGKKLHPTRVVVDVQQIIYK